MGQFCRAHRSIRPHALSNFHQNLLWNLVFYGCHKWLQNKQCGRRVRPTRYAPPASNPDLWPFDLETGMRVASMAGKLSSKFGHARPLDSRIICYVRDVRTERRTDGRTKATLTVPFPTVGGIILATRCEVNQYFKCAQTIVDHISRCSVVCCIVLLCTTFRLLWDLDTVY